MTVGRSKNANGKGKKMILRDSYDNGVGHTEVYDPDSLDKTPAAFLPGYGQSNAQNFIYNLWASAEKI